MLIKSQRNTSNNKVRPKTIVPSKRKKTNIEENDIANGIEAEDVQIFSNRKKIGKITDYIFKKETNLFTGLSFEITKYIEFLYGKSMLNSFFQVVFAFVSILSGFIQYELSYKNTSQDNMNGSILTAEWICFITSIGLWMTFIFEYFIECELLFYVKKLPENMWRQDYNQISNMVKNIIIFLWHPNPIFHNQKFTIYNNKFNFDQELFTNSVMFSLCLMRLWFIFKLLVVFSDYSSARTQRVCRMNNFSVSFSFCMKALMQNIPYHVYGTLLVLCLIFCSCNLRVYERGLDEVSGLDFANYWNCIWCIIITMTTVGFGDYFPSSIIGRIIGIMACFNGVFLISMLVVTITNVLNLSNHEQNVYMILEKVTLESEKLEVARDLIAKYFNIIRKSKKEDKKSFEANNDKIKEMKYNFLRQYNAFQDKKTEIESTYPPYSNYDAINENLTYLEGEFQNIEAKQGEISSLIEKICKKLNIE